MDFNTLLYEAEYRVVGADPKFALPHHDDSVEIIQPWSDGGFFIVKNNIFPISPGTLFLIDAANSHYSNPSDVKRYSRSKVIIPYSLFRILTRLCNLDDILRRPLAEKGGIAYPFSPSGSAAKEIDRLMHNIKNAYDDMDSPLSQVHITSSLVQILEILAQEGTQATEQESNVTINRMAVYLNNNMNNWDSLRMSDIASALHISESRASHLFKELTGKTLTQYTTDLRIAQAKKMLLTSEMKVWEISDALKFQNATIFCKYFKKYVGCTAKQYRSAGGISLKTKDT